MFKKLGLLSLGCLMSTQVFATSISVLHGNDFRDDLGYRSSRTTLTIEEFSVWEYGTVFFYYDITDPMGKDQGPKYYSNQFFGGIAATLSLSQTTGWKLQNKFLRDISVRYEIENGSALGDFNFQNYFYGLQYDLIIPGFDFFSFNTVLRDNPRESGVGYQFGMFWQVTWEFWQKTRLKFTGFLAASPWEGNLTDDQNPSADPKGRYLSSQPQILYDLGYAWFNKKDRLEIGLEYAYFLNRFQFRRYDEKSLQGMVKVSF